APRSSDTYAGVSPTWTPPMNNWPTFSSRSRRASVWSGQSAGTSGLADGEDGDAPGVCGVVFGSDGDGEAVSDAAGRDSVSLGAAEGSSPPHADRADVITTTALSQPVAVATLVRIPASSQGRSRRRREGSGSGQNSAEHRSSRR